MAFSRMILAAIFMILISDSTAKTNDLVHDICSATASSSIKFEDCASALESDPRTPKADLKLLAKITMELGISNSTNTESLIKNMASNVTTPETLRKPLKECLESYVNLIASFKGALTELDVDPMSANYDVKMVGDYALYCENALTREKAKIGAVSIRNSYAMLYSSIGYVITARLQ
ncbi:cell wall / vacuolar inhibitor of fructosidase 2-like [Mercurialis annua]|uniref:cell wall / vacuolar inhibitor of fructosidase 2-like n=1 Tax=Mercurialis annua TaxID=3986 RepID=UPI00215FADF6|nr:cell wall / vacuolar inhibitor of fructosidase 2-like [Mercurialis annua]